MDEPSEVLDCLVVCRCCRWSLSTLSFLSHSYCRPSVRPFDRSINVAFLTSARRVEGHKASNVMMSLRPSGRPIVALYLSETSRSFVVLLLLVQVQGTSFCGCCVPSPRKEPKKQGPVHGPDRTRTNTHPHFVGHLLSFFLLSNSSALWQLRTRPLALSLGVALCF